MKTPSGLAIASIQVWGKGYRITEDNEEFQRYLPLDNTPLSQLETNLSSVRWGRILEQLYKLTDRELLAQKCVLFDDNQLVAIAFGKSEDLHGRGSLVLCAASVRILWRSDSLGDIAARAVVLANRLAVSYGDVFRGNPATIGTQLRRGTFLPSRDFELDEESPDRTIDWKHVMAAVQRWRGVTGVSTSKLMSAGANILIGTRHEAETAQSRTEVDGFYDIREREIIPLTTTVVPWSADSNDSKETGSQTALHQQASERIAAALERIASNLDRRSPPDNIAQTLERVAIALEELLRTEREFVGRVKKGKWYER